MKRFIAVIIITMTAFSAYAQDNNPENLQIKNTDEGTALIPAEENTQVVNEAEPEEQIKSRPVIPASKFNKKKISLDRHEEKKWYAIIGGSYATPINKYGSMFNYRLSIAAGYEFTKFINGEIFLSYGDGSSKINGESWRGTMYDVGAQAVIKYPFELPVGSIYPYLSIGGSYTFGDARHYYMNAGIEESSKYNLSSGAVHAKAGVRYVYNVLITGIYVGYIYSFSKPGPIEDLSAIHYGLELGIKF